ncbi:MAG: DASS family sodium-coupled anion symporter [Longimicrobiales bacterium]|nr:DASS family sodium-coupled anion symporter [Longimicrobiales bacterium]
MPHDDSEAPSFRRIAGLLGGPLLFIALLAFPVPAGMAPAAWRTAAVGLLMAVWWVTEAIPIPATALLPLVLFPVLDVTGIGDTAAPYASPIIFLFMGGFMIAAAMQRWQLHRRIALTVVHALGTRPHRLVLGFMLATAFLSMWVSNTATAVMMMPIGLSVIGLVRPGQDDDALPGQLAFGTALMLGIAYAASIGGLGTLIGTPPNALLAGFLETTYGYELGFARWMLVGLPLSVLALPLVWLYLTRLAFPIGIDEIPGGRAMIRDELRDLGPVSAGERRVGIVFGLTALAWITRPLLDDVVPGLSDAGIAMGAALALFLIPVDRETGRFALDWGTAQDLPWGVLILFGGGLSLAAAVTETGLAEWIGAALSGLGSWPTVLLVAGVTAVIVFLTELTSNTATAAAFLPILGPLAVALGENPLLLAVPAALGASCAFMMPVATPPNAIVYGSGYITIPQMARAGLALNLLFILLITGLAYTVLLVALGVTPGTLPGWAG